MLGWATLAQDKSNKKRGASSTTTQSSRTKKPLTPEQQAALYVLAQLSETVKTLDDEQLKIRVQAQVADILWRYEEPRARRQFEEAFNAIASVPLDKQNAASTSGIPRAQTSALSQLRGEILSLIAQHDAELAEKLIKATVGAKSNTDGDASASNDTGQSERAGLYLQTAASIANINPERAVQLAESSFASGLDPSVLNVLFALRQKNPAQADALYRLALAAARRDTKPAAMNIQILASYALPEFTTSGVVGSASLAPNSSAATQPASPMALEFLDFVHDTFLRLADPAQVRTSNPVDYMIGQRLLPFFVRYVPDKAPMFRNLLDMMARRASQSGAIDAVNKLLQPADTDDLLKQAEKAPDQFQRDLLYFRATLAAAGSGEFDRALSLVEKINAGDLRSSLDSLIRFQAASSLLDKGEVDAALRYAKNMSDVRQRAFLLAKVARALFNKKDIARASEVLADAEQMLLKADEGVEKAQALLIIAEVEARLDPARGFEVMATTIKAFNNADSDTDNKNKLAPAGAGLSGMLTKVFKLETPDFASSFSILARTDFNRAVQLAQTLKKKDRAVLAQLAACRGVLVNNHEKGT